jgi:hypothetical protein
MQRQLGHVLCLVTAASPHPLLPLLKRQQQEVRHVPAQTAAASPQQLLVLRTLKLLASNSQYMQQPLSRILCHLAANSLQQLSQPFESLAADSSLRHTPPDRLPLEPQVCTHQQMLLLLLLLLQQQQKQLRHFMHHLAAPCLQQLSRPFNSLPVNCSFRHMLPHLALRPPLELYRQPSSSLKPPAAQHPQQ